MSKKVERGGKGKGERWERERGKREEEMMRNGGRKPYNNLERELFLVQHSHNILFSRSQKWIRWR